MIIDVIKWLISFTFFMPILSIIIILLVLRLFVSNKKKALLLTVDLSTILLIISVHFHFVALFKQSLLFYFIILLAALHGILYLTESKNQNTVSGLNLMKKTWRMTFLLFFALYIILTIYGVANGVISHSYSFHDLPR